MSDREKLIEILSVPIYPHLDADPVEVVADYLIDNGVTVQKWIPVSERLPEKSGYYLVVTAKGSIVDLSYSSRWQAFNAFDGCDNEFAIIVTHWMPLPELPKECE